MLYNETTTTHSPVQEAVAALTTRFGYNLAQAYALVNDTTVSEIAGMAAEIHRQADAFENVIAILIYDNHIKTHQAIQEIQSVLTNITKSSYPDLGYVTYLHALKLDYKFLENGLPQNVTTSLDAIPTKRYEDDLIDADFELEALRLGTIAAREKPRLDAIKAKELKDYTIKLVMDKVGISENDATIVVNYIPLDQYQSVYHHLHGRTGFSVRFNNYVEKIMLASELTFEETKQILYDFSQGERTDATSAATKYLTDNEIKTVIKFEKWHFALVSEKTCTHYQNKFLFHYSQNSSLPSCVPDLTLYQPKQPSSFQPLHLAFINKNLDSVSHSNAGFILKILVAVSGLAFLYMLVRTRSLLCANGLFGERKKTGKPRTNTRRTHASESEVLLRL